jgi:GntR family transcriptional regulator
MNTMQVGRTSERVIHELINMITRGEYSPSGRLPAQRDLARRFGVSRATVSSALSVLSSQGLVERRAGRTGGTLVSGADPSQAPVVRMPGLVIAAKMERQPGQSIPVPELMREQGFMCGTRVLDSGIAAADAETAEKLGLGHGEEVVFMDRVRLANGEPLSFEQAYIPAKRFRRILELDLTQSLLETLRTEFGVRIRTTSERIEVLGANRERATWLQIPLGAPIFSITRWTSDVNGDGVEFSRDFFRTDRTQLFVQSTHPVAGTPAAAPEEE